MKSSRSRAEMRRKEQYMSFVLAPIAVVFKSIGWLYNHLGRSVLDRIGARRTDARFGRDIASSLPHLFIVRQARLERLPASDYGRKRYFDNARAIAATKELRFQFERFRGDLIVYVASPKRPFHWEEVHTVLTWLDSQEGKPRQQYSGWPDSSLIDVDDFLEQHWKRLVVAATAGDE